MCRSRSADPQYRDFTLLTPKSRDEEAQDAQDPGQSSRFGCTLLPEVNAEPEGANYKKKSGRQTSRGWASTSGQSWWSGAHFRLAGLAT